MTGKGRDEGGTARDPGRGAELLGAVLAGGGSRRYGSPKWAAPVDGVAMGRRAVLALEPWTTEVVALAGARGTPSRAEVARVLGVVAVPDRRPGQGPLGGLHTALRLARERELPGVALLACDLPLVGPGAVEALLRAWSDRQRAVVPEAAVRPGDRPMLQPVCALYPTAWIPAIEEALDHGRRALHELVEGMDPIRLPAARLDEAEGRTGVLMNVNTPAERMRAEARLHDGPPLVCVVGKKNSGKTGFTVALVAELVRRGRRVMTVKHGHGFDLDTEGTDSWRHRHEGGAERVLMVGPEQIAMTGAWGPAGEPPLRSLVDRHLAGADIVVAEGWKAGPDPKVEVFRAEAHHRPVYATDSPVRDTFLAAVSDSEAFRPVGVPTYPLGARDTVTKVADRVEEVLLSDDHPMIR